LQGCLDLQERLGTGDLQETSVKSLGPWDLLDRREALGTLEPMGCLVLKEPEESKETKALLD